MKHRHMMMTGCLTAVLMVASSQVAWAQRGTGENSGVARGPAPEVVSLRGVVTDARIGRCESTTGRADLGAHLLVTDEDGEALNVHLGPLAAVEDLLSQVPDGTAIEARVFTTEALPAAHFIAVDVTVTGDTTVLRDENLRPRWALPRGRGGMRAGGGRGSNRTDGGARRGGGCWWVDPLPAPETPSNGVPDVDPDVPGDDQ
jgi:hypothetical protein